MNYGHTIFGDDFVDRISKSKCNTCREKKTNNHFLTLLQTTRYEDRNIS